MKFSWSTSERVALKRLAEYSSTPREIKISTFRALRYEQSRQDFSTKQQEAAAAAAGKFSPPAGVSVHSTDLIDRGEDAEVKERRQTEEDKTFQSLKSSSSVPLLDLSPLNEVGARTPAGPLKDNQGATSAIGEQTFEARLRQPSSFPRWQTQLRQCMKTQSALLPRKSQSAPDLPSTTRVPHGIGKQQTWIKRQIAEKKRRTSQKNLFDDKAVILEHPRRFSEIQDGPPKLEIDWLGNLEQPAYRTDHRDSFQREQTRQCESAHPLSVVRLGYGYTDALEPRYQTTYSLHFQHPDLRNDQLKK